MNLCFVFQINSLLFNSVCQLSRFDFKNNNLLQLLLFFTITIDLYNRDLQTTNILFTRNVSSNKNDWILSELPLLALCCLLCRLVSSLINALEDLCLREISISVSKLLAVLLLPVYLFIPFLYYTLLLPV